MTFIKWIKSSLGSGAPPADVTFALEWQPLAAGGLHALQAAIDRGKVRLVVVDTLHRALGRAGHLDSVGLTVAIGALQDLCKTTGASILTVDHHRKPSSQQGDPIDDTRSVGSTGKAALVDAALGLYRERGVHDATLHATGWDMPPVELVIRWDGERCSWQAVGEAREVRKEGLQGAILAAIRELDELGEGTGTTAVARHLHKDKANVSRELADLLRAGKVVKGRPLPPGRTGTTPTQPLDNTTEQPSQPPRVWTSLVSALPSTRSSYVMLNGAQRNAVEWSEVKYLWRRPRLAPAVRCPCDPLFPPSHLLAERRNATLRGLGSRGP